MSAVETSDAAAGEATPSETAPAAPAAPPPPDDGTRLSNQRPFPGLRPFFFADRDFFFGRERQAFALYRLVENGRFIAVIGGSGSGKSSLVLAGLQGLLADETADAGGPTWAFLDMRPGGAPITRLAGALATLSDRDSPDETARRRDRIEWTLRQSSFSFDSALAEAGGLGGRSLILVVDQFEELFRFGLAGLGYRRGGVEEARRRDEATQFVQILLDADRRRIQNVRVLITMRSDFIGDCANFHGLSEAVSATQYLVPNLTRSQLEDAIRKPVEKAGGTIEPELVERLLNDCGDELDQLPVLQHCLMRLWDRAGAETPSGGPRHLRRATYDAIGRMTDALSRHADEIFAQCAGEALAIEQAFRALSEVDREGRAIRRALRFDKLLAETGVGESDLRAGLDRFRAPNCSFLAPSLSVSPTLAADERIDIGHEALLRRWKTIAGRTEAIDPKTGRPPPGWLSEEQIDGQRYHTLVSLLDGTAGGERATLDDPERTKDWWTHLPRTAAWADRYGGKFEQVKTLIDDAIEAKRRSRLQSAADRGARRRRGPWSRRLDMDRARKGAGKLDKSAMTSRALKCYIRLYRQEQQLFSRARNGSKREEVEKGQTQQPPGAPYDTYLIRHANAHTQKNETTGVKVAAAEVSAPKESEEGSAREKKTRGPRVELFKSKRHLRCRPILHVFHVWRRQCLARDLQGWRPLDGLRRGLEIGRIQEQPSVEALRHQNWRQVHSQPRSFHRPGHEQQSASLL